MGVTAGCTARWREMASKPNVIYVLKKYLGAAKVAAQFDSTAAAKRGMPVEQIKHQLQLRTAAQNDVAALEEAISRLEGLEDF